MFDAGLFYDGEEEAVREAVDLLVRLKRQHSLGKPMDGRGSRPSSPRSSMLGPKPSIPKKPANMVCVCARLRAFFVCLNRPTSSRQAGQCTVVRARECCAMRAHALKWSHSHRRTSYFLPFLCALMHARASIGLGLVLTPLHVSFSPRHYLCSRGERPLCLSCRPSLHWQRCRRGLRAREPSPLRSRRDPGRRKSSPSLRHGRRPLQR